MPQSNKIIVKITGQLGDFHLNADFTAPGQGVTALFGPSGCGKTSILRSIAGLNHLKGVIQVGQNVWQNENSFLPAYKRPIGYVFQEASLFSHLNVYANLKFGMGKRENTSALSLDEVITMLGLAHLVERLPKHLSGGEKQRVAIGRALLSDPKVLLMDEPLSALDTQMREEIMPFIERLRYQLHLPIFYITHDMTEVERLADHLVLIEDGKVLGAGSLETLQADTALPIARTRNAAVNLDAEVKERNSETGLVRLSVHGGQLLTPLTNVMSSDLVRIRIAASDVSIAVEKPERSSILNILPARILNAVAINAFEMLLSLALGNKGEGAHILCRISTWSWHALQLREDMNVFAQIKGVALIPRR